LLRSAYKVVASEFRCSILIDGRRELAEASPAGLIDDHVIQDTHHPTLRGYVALAEALLRELNRRKVFDRRLAEILPLDPAECAEHFGMDAQKWAVVCGRAADHYLRVAGYRYDPTERLAKSGRYTHAAKLLKGGTAPDELGLLGHGLSTLRTFEFWTCDIRVSAE
jgi:hypothetical protein